MDVDEVGSCCSAVRAACGSRCGSTAVAVSASTSPTAAEVIPQSAAAPNCAVRPLGM